MKHLIYVLLLGLFISACESEMRYKYSNDFPIYQGNDLGFTPNNNEVTFKVWSPEAEEVRIHLYETEHEEYKIFTENEVGSGLKI